MKGRTNEEGIDPDGDKPVDDAGWRDELECSDGGKHGAPQERNRIEKILEPENLTQAWKRVRANKGAPGIDGMTVASTMNRFWIQVPSSVSRLSTSKGPMVTVSSPPARVAAQYRNDLPSPYRRYAMGPVWRNEKPGPGRGPRPCGGRCRGRGDRLAHRPVTRHRPSGSAPATLK